MIRPALFAAGIAIAAYGLYGRQATAAQIEFVIAAATAAAALYALIRSAVDQLQGRPTGLLRPALAAAGLAVAGLLVARHGRFWLSGLAGLNMLLALWLIWVARREPPPPPASGKPAGPWSQSPVKRKS